MLALGTCNFYFDLAGILNIFVGVIWFRPKPTKPKPMDMLTFLVLNNCSAKAVLGLARSFQRKKAWELVLLIKPFSSLSLLWTTAYKEDPKVTHWFDRIMWECSSVSWKNSISMHNSKCHIHAHAHKICSLTRAYICMLTIHFVVIVIIVWLIPVD